MIHFEGTACMRETIIRIYNSILLLQYEQVCIDITSESCTYEHGMCMRPFAGTTAGKEVVHLSIAISQPRAIIEK